MLFPHSKLGVKGHNESPFAPTLYEHMKSELAVAKCQEHQDRFIALIPQSVSRVVATLLKDSTSFDSATLAVIFVAFLPF